MKYLLDTHIFIWWVLDNPKLSDNHKATIANTSNLIYLSSASTWEMIIKSSIGKINLPEQADIFIKKQLDLNNFHLLDIKIDHTFEILKLPFIHKDPFDRILISQARYEEMILITDDIEIKKYDVLVAQSLAYR